MLDITEAIKEIVEDEMWQKEPKSFRIQLNEWCEILYDIKYDTFCIPLGTRCRCIINPTIEDLTLFCKNKPTPIFRFKEYKLPKKSLVNNLEFHKKFAVIANPTGNIRYFFQEEEIVTGLLQFTKYTPKLKISKNKSLSRKYSKEVKVLGLSTPNLITDSETVIAMIQFLATCVKRMETIKLIHTSPIVFQEEGKALKENNNEAKLQPCFMGNLPWVQISSSTY